MFAPTPTLTVTIEEVGGQPDIHLHAGGQGVWEARMAKVLGAAVRYCTVLSGETGRAIRHLLEDEGIAVSAVEGHASSSAYIHDRRGGQRREVVAARGDRLSRHELDELHALVLREGLDAGTAVLSGAVRDDAVPVDTYRRLAADLGAGDCRVIADLSGERLDAALAGGLSVARVADNELVHDGRAADAEPGELVRAMRQMADDGADAVLVSRGSLPALLLAEDRVEMVEVPQLQVVDERGAGDSMTGALAAALAAGRGLHEAVLLGAAAGAANVARHGLGSGDAETIRGLAHRVTIAEFADDAEARPAEQASLSDLAQRTRVE